MYLGRIITKSKNLRTLDFVCKREEYVEDYSLPTLIVGKENAKKVFGSSLSFIDRSPDEMLSWTFMKTENRQNFETDLENFNKKIINKIKADFKYHSLDFICAKYSVVKRLITLLKNSPNFIYITDKQIYIYCNYGRKIVIGISLQEIEYIGIKPEKVITYLKKLPKCVFIEDENFLNHETKSYFSNISIFIPYLYFLKTL